MELVDVDFRADCLELDIPARSRSRRRCEWRRFFVCQRGLDGWLPCRSDSDRSWLEDPLPADACFWEDTDSRDPGVPGSFHLSRERRAETIARSRCMESQNVGPAAAELAPPKPLSDSRLTRWGMDPNDTPVSSAQLLHYVRFLGNWYSISAACSRRCRKPFALRAPELRHSSIAGGS